MCNYYCMQYFVNICIFKIKTSSTLETVQPSSVPVINVQKSESEPNINEVTVRARAKMYSNINAAVENDRKSVMQIRASKIRQVLLFSRRSCS